MIFGIFLLIIINMFFVVNFSEFTTGYDGYGYAWVQHFDNYTWGGTNAYWDGDSWVESGIGMVLGPRSYYTDWNEDYRPVKMRVTGDINNSGDIRLWAGPSTEYFIVYDTNNQEGLGRTIEVDINWSKAINDTYDFSRLDLYGFIDVTNIEFLEYTYIGYRYSNFSIDSRTTNLSAGGPLYNVSNLTLCNEFACINYPNRTNVSNQDLDKHIQYGDCYVSVNASGLDYTLNATAYLLMNNSDGHCGPNDLFVSDSFAKSDEFIRKFGRYCDECEKISVQNNLAKYRVPHFSSYAIGSNANLTIYDSHEGTFANPGETVTFYAEYEHLNGNFIENATCLISVDGAAQNTMTEGVEVYEYQQSFSTTGSHTFNVSCGIANYSNLTTTDTVDVGSSVPEFGSITIMLVLLVLVGGFIYYRRNVL